MGTAPPKPPSPVTCNPENCSYKISLPVLQESCLVHILYYEDKIFELERSLVLGANIFYFLDVHQYLYITHLVKKWLPSFFAFANRYRKRDENVPTLCIATASAAKFAEVLLEAGLPECKSDKIEVLREKENR